MRVVAVSIVVVLVSYSAAVVGDSVAASGGAADGVAPSIVSADVVAWAVTALEVVPVIGSVVGGAVAVVGGEISRRA